MKKFVGGHNYRVKKSFSIKCGPLHYFAIQGEVLLFKGKSSGYAHFYGKNPSRLVLLTGKETFKYLEEIEV